MRALIINYSFILHHKLNTSFSIIMRALIKIMMIVFYNVMRLMKKMRALIVKYFICLIFVMKALIILIMRAFSVIYNEALHHIFTEASFNYQSSFLEVTTFP